MAALAVDALGLSPGDLYAAFPEVDILILLASGVTEDASGVDPSAKTGVVGPVISGAHGPVAALFRVPGERKLYQLPGLCSTGVATAMVSGTEPVVNRSLQLIGD